jgi:hypothetical protein
MGAAGPKSKIALGFLTIVELPQHGLCGGYLVLNGCGRPVEFHCTAPIKPNRAQEILYGPTLEPFLYGEQIGQTLLSKARSEALLVCTDREPALAVREFVELPVALVFPHPAAEASNAPPVTAAPADAAPQSVVCRLDPAHRTPPALIRFRLGCNELAVPEEAPSDRQRIVERIGALADAFDLAEPFDRIREAIHEAHRAARQAT